MTLLGEPEGQREPHVAAPDDANLDSLTPEEFRGASRGHRERESSFAWNVRKDPSNIAGIKHRRQARGPPVLRKRNRRRGKRGGPARTPVPRKRIPVAAHEGHRAH